MHLGRLCTFCIVFGIKLTHLYIEIWHAKVIIGIIYRTLVDLGYIWVRWIGKSDIIYKLGTFSNFFLDFVNFGIFGHIR